MTKSITLEDALGNNDYGLIIDGNTGELKGLWIPDNKKTDPIPFKISFVMRHYFGVDPTDSETIH